MPDPKPGESKDDYMDRCMGDAKSIEDYPNPAQRAAVCNSMFERKDAGMHEEEEYAEAAEYKGKKVTLGKPFRTPNGPRKFAVYVQNESGRVVIVRFGDPNMEIKRDDPGRRKNFRSRHNCDNPGPRTKARYWSCRMWERSKSVTQLTSSEEQDDKLWFDLWSETEGEVIYGIEEVIEELVAEEEACCSSCAEAAEVGKDTYDNPAEAAGRAKEMGCEGIHETDGKFMPCESHEEYMEKAGGKNAEAASCPIGEERGADGICRPVNVTMEATVEEIVAKVEASTGRSYIEIRGIAFHEGMNKNRWSLTRRGADVAANQMPGADLTLNHPKPLAAGGFTRNMDGGVDEAVVGEVTEATVHDTEAGYDVRYVAVVERPELFEALESGMWLRPGYGVSIGGYGTPIKADEDGMVFDEDFKFDHLAIVHRPAYHRANIEKAQRIDHEMFKKIASVDEDSVTLDDAGETSDGLDTTVEALQYGKPDKNDPRKTPAKPSERRKGSKKNPPGSAKKPNANIKVSEETRARLQSMMREHNAKNKGSKASMGALLTVYRRGAGAFSTSHAPNMSRGGWGIARVKAFLYLLRNGRPSNPNYVQDNDLLPKGHPRARKTASETLIPQPLRQGVQAQEVTPMSDEIEITETEQVEASEIEALQAELVLARAEIENFKAMEAAKAEESRLALVAEATELGLKGHEDLSEPVLASLIASWTEAHPAPAPIEMAPVAPAPAVASVAPAPVEAAKPVVANYLNGKIVETESDLYARAWNAWASAWNRTLSGVEAVDGRFRAPRFDEINN